MPVFRHGWCTTKMINKQPKVKQNMKKLKICETKVWGWMNTVKLAIKQELSVDWQKILTEKITLC